MIGKAYINNVRLDGGYSGTAKLSGSVGIYDSNGNYASFTLDDITIDKINYAIFDLIERKKHEFSKQIANLDVKPLITNEDKAKAIPYSDGTAYDDDIPF